MWLSYVWFVMPMSAYALANRDVRNAQTSRYLSSEDFIIAVGSTGDQNRRSCSIHPE